MERSHIAAAIEESGLLSVVREERAEQEIGSRTYYRHILYCRLKAGVTEKRWFTEVAEPVALMIGRVGGRVDIGVKYFWEKEPEGKVKRRFAYFMDFTTTVPLELADSLRQLWREGLPEDKGEDYVLASNEPVIEKPLVWASPARNTPRLIPSEYGSLTGRPYRQTAGAGDSIK